MRTFKAWVLRYDGTRTEWTGLRRTQAVWRYNWLARQRDETIHEYGWEVE